MDTNAGFVFAGGPPSDLFLFWPGSLEPSWDRCCFQKSFKNQPKLLANTLVLNVSASQISDRLCRIPNVK